jgi:carbon-monoxide dehydrogenase large subunit
MAGMREVAFVRSPVAHALLRQVSIPEAFKNVVFTAKDLTGVKPMSSSTSLKGFKHSIEPILATDKIRFVGEPVAMCLAATLAEAEDIAAAVTIELDELPAVTEMLKACESGEPLVHAEWGDNIFIDVTEGQMHNHAVTIAPIKVTRKIRTEKSAQPDTARFRWRAEG